MNNRVLLLGHTGKLGLALNEAFGGDAYTVVGKNSKDFDASQLNAVQDLVKEVNPALVLNAVGFVGVDPCESDPHSAFQINTIYPKLLAELSNELGYTLVHFSTDAVFSDAEIGELHTETSSPRPKNIYGLTKYGGDCMIASLARRYYILRIPILFGRSIKNNQFVEKMLQRTKEGARELRVSADVISSPTYSRDVATEAKRIYESGLDYGLYHVANHGTGSLHELIDELVRFLGLDVEVTRASHSEFTGKGVKNLCTPIRSERIPGLRPWRSALSEYCASLVVREENTP